MKLWDLEAGMQIATSRFQPCGVRALALDQDMLACSASKVCSWSVVSSSDASYMAPLGWVRMHWQLYLALATSAC